MFISLLDALWDILRALNSVQQWELPSQCIVQGIGVIFPEKNNERNKSRSVDGADCDNERSAKVREFGSCMPYGKGQPQTACATQERSKRKKKSQTADGFQENHEAHTHIDKHSNASAASLYFFFFFFHAHTQSASQLLRRGVVTRGIPNVHLTWQTN